MRIALLADVHANLPALEAVLKHAAARGADEYWNLGDMVGYGPSPRECIHRLRQACARHVVGNHDPKCAHPAHAGRMRERNGDPDKIFSFEWTCRALTREDVAFIDALPVRTLADAGGLPVLMTHGTPVHVADSLTPRTPAKKFETLAPMVRGAGAGVMVCGHTHEFFDRTHGGVRFVNPGGVGRSFDGDPRASYALLETGGGRLRVRHYRVAYDLVPLTGMLRARGFPDRLVQTFVAARNIEELDGLAAADEGRLVRAAAGLAAALGPDTPHVRRVEQFAAALFDDTRQWHGCGGRERAWLRSAAWLHDIGWTRGGEKHHKHARDMILEDRTLPLTSRERMMVALIARYHRGALPSENHQGYGDLNGYDRETVAVLAALLRVADGLDRSHEGRVSGVALRPGPQRWTVCVSVRGDRDVSAELAAARKKADLLATWIGRKVRCCVPEGDNKDRGEGHGKKILHRR